MKPKIRKNRLVSPAFVILSGVIVVLLILVLGVASSGDFGRKLKTGSTRETEEKQCNGSRACKCWWGDVELTESGRPKKPARTPDKNIQAVWHMCLENKNLTETQLSRAQNWICEGLCKRYVDVADVGNGKVAYSKIFVSQVKMCSKATTSAGPIGTCAAGDAGDAPKTENGNKVRGNTLRLWSKCKGTATCGNGRDTWKVSVDPIGSGEYCMYYPSPPDKVVRDALLAECKDKEPDDVGNRVAKIRKFGAFCTERGNRCEKPSESPTKTPDDDFDLTPTDPPQSSP